jgi:DNA-binding NtrC family response regulator
MKRAAIIDDDEGVIEALQAALELFNFECIGIQEKQNSKILRALQESTPDVIFLDLLLSGTDGPSVAKDIRSSTRLKNLPIILMSAHPRGKNIAEEIPVNGFLPKPFSLDLLQSLLRSVLK